MIRRLLDNAAGRGMGRLFVVVIPALMIASALLGVFVGSIVPAVVLAIPLGLLAVVFVLAIVSARARALAGRVDRAAAGHDVATSTLFEGREEWRELADAIDRMSASLRSQADQIVEERIRSQRLLEELPSAVLLFDDRSTVVYANRAAKALFSLAAEPGGAPFDDSAPRSLVDAVEESRELAQQIDVEIEFDERLLAARASTLGSGDVVLVVRDITRARRLDAVRRDFVVNASHELKTPVAGIQALAESLALALRNDPPRAARMTGRIELEAARLARLVRDLLDLARLEELDSARERRRVDIATVIHAQIERLRPLADERDITIDADLSARSILVAVPEDVRSIVANLLENAVRYNRDGGSVTVCMTRRDGTLLLEVVDTGEGVPEGDRDRIFERFYRVDKARSRAAGGTGLGLALVRHATERHGGRLHLDSQVGVGSTFRVELPIAGD